MKATPKMTFVRRAASRGFSLAEVMISLAIGLLLLGGLVTLFSNSSRAHAEQKKASEQTQNGSLGVWELGRDVALAGYYGEFYMLPPATATLPDPCATAVADLFAALALPLQGYDAPATSPLSCLADSDFVPGTDILVVRRADIAALAAADVPTANDVYLQSIPSVADIQLGNGSVAVGTTRKADGTATVLFKKDGVTAAPIRKYHVHIYFIAPCSVPADGSDNCTGVADDGGRPIPTLKRLELVSVGGATAWRMVPLVEGVQNMQFDYGVDTLPAVPDPTTGLPGDGAPDSYVAAPIVTDWPNVVSLRVRLLARATLPTAGHVDTKTYDMGLAGTVGPLNDAFKRHLFSDAMRLTNVSSRREIPQ